MINKILILTMLFSSFLIAENQFKDLNYLAEKTVIRETAERLEVLKNLYTYNSKEYNILHEAQQVILDKLPVDAFGTYSRIKLNNVLDKELTYKNHMEEKNNILQADTDLNFMLSQKNKLKTEEVKTVKKNSKKEEVNIKEVLENSHFGRMYQ